MSIIFACGIVEVSVVNHKERTKKLLRKRGEIAANYLRGWFIIDLVSIFPVEIVAMLIEAQADDGLSSVFATEANEIMN